MSFVLDICNICLFGPLYVNFGVLRYHGMGWIAEWTEQGLGNLFYRVSPVQIQLKPLK